MLSLTLKFLLSLPLFFALPELKVSWLVDSPEPAVKIVMQGYDSQLEQCVKSSLEVRYRFYFKLCRKRSWWFNSCEKEQSEVHSLQYDPISQTFRLISDRLYDKEVPQVATIQSEQEARSNVASMSKLLLLPLLQDIGKNVIPKRSYLSVRVLASCRGEYSQSMEKLAYFLSLGMLRTSGYDSTWIDFQLDQ